MKQVTKAVIMVAGWGTRMLPITKSIEKCMLPIGNRPVIDYIVQDVIKAGVTDIYFVVGEQSDQLQGYYRSNIPLNDYLRRKGRADLLQLVRPLSGVNIHFIVQTSTGKYGTSVPAGLVNEFIASDESVLYMNGDNFFYRADGGSSAADLIAAVAAAGATSGLFGNPVPDEKLSLFGLIEKDNNNHFVKIVEKPRAEDAPSNLNNSGTYLFDKAIFELASSLPANPERGEYEITDAINAYVQQGEPMVVVEATADYVECGSVEGWLAANNRIIGNGA